MYDQVLKNNNFFLTTVATVPINLEFRAWHAVISPNTSSDNEPISLYDHLIRKPWFLHIEEVDLPDYNDKNQSARSSSLG